jgi:hypothetical protein
METETTIANDVWDPTTHSIRVAGGTDAQPLVLTEMPAEPCVLHHTFILESTQEHFTCTVNLVYQLVKGYQEGPTAIPGLITSEGEGILSQHWYLTPLTGTHALGSGNGMVAVTVGTLGTTLTLPNPAALDTPTHITMYIVDAGVGYLTVLPFGTEEIGDYGNTAPPPITGKGSQYEFSLVAGNWHLKTTTKLKLAELGGQTLCVGPGGSVDSAATNPSVNFDHTSTCLVPVALGLKEGAFLHACSSFSITTGSASPAMAIGLKVGSTVVFKTTNGTPTANVTARSMTVCVHIILGADPTSATPTYATPQGTGGAIDNGPDAGDVVQPVTVDWSVDKTLTWYSVFDTAGTGTNTLTQLAAWTGLFRK